MNEEIQLLNAIREWCTQFGIGVGTRTGHECYVYWKDKIFKITIVETGGIPKA